MRKGKRKLLLSENKLSDKKQPQDKNPAETASIIFTHPRVFSNLYKEPPMPTEEQIKAILAKTGKTQPEHELNCGSCGYSSCREKAIAVFQGKADINMCLPFFRERSENISNTILEHSPNAIIAFDDDFCVQALNPAAEKMFKTTASDAFGFPLPAFFGDTAFDDARDTGKVIAKEIHIGEIDKTVDQMVIYIKEHHTYLAFLKDISDEIAHRKQMEELRDSTINVAQKVIEKQMIAAQEIASLLGETTAETKVALTNLKRTMNTLSE